MRPLLPLLLSVALGCQTSISQVPAGSLALTPTYLQPCRAWEVVQGASVVGVVVEFDGGARGARFYSVRNAWQQELGLVDAVGRAWRYRPHAREADWLGSGTVLEGAARVLGVEGEVALFDVRLDALREEGELGGAPLNG